jgi:hypothetical protein
MHGNVLKRQCDKIFNIFHQGNHVYHPFKHLKKCILRTNFIYVFYKILTIHSDYFPRQLSVCHNVVALCCL